MEWCVCERAHDRCAHGECAALEQAELGSIDRPSTSAPPSWPSCTLQTWVAFSSEQQLQCRAPLTRVGGQHAPVAAGGAVQAKQADRNHARALGGALCEGAGNGWCVC